MTRYPRVLFYAVNGLGLGHVTRLLAIARKLRARTPHAEILFLTSSEAEDVIYREGFAAFKVPSRTLRARTLLRPATYARTLQLVTWNLIAGFRPHLLVVDTFPAGSLQELLPVLRWDGKKAFVFRAQRLEAAEAPLMQNTLPLYDLVLIPHDKEEYVPPLPESLERTWTGPVLIRDRDEALPRAEARAYLGLPEDKPVVYLNFGGGGDPKAETFLRATVDALAGHTQAHLAVACGPLARATLTRRLDVTPIDHFPMAEMFAAFDAALSAAGYNTTMELLHHGVPTAFVPFSRAVDDQETRARTAALTGAALCLDRPAPDTLRAALAHLLEPDCIASMRVAAHAAVTHNGAERAADALVALLHGA